MTHYVMDYETLINCFVAVFTDYKTDDTKVFVIHKTQNDFTQLAKFLFESADEEVFYISFNGIAFDSQITEFILQEYDYLEELSAEDIAHSLYMQAQSTIERSNAGEFPEFSQRDMKIRQLDVFKLNHWDNPAKRSSLKWIQFSMDWDNVRDMPIHHSTYITTKEEIETITSYCVNDVRSTKRIMEISKEQIMLRKTLTEEYNINLFSASEPKISKELFLLFLSEKMGINKYDLKQMRTIRNEIKVGDIILDYINFNRKEFKSIHDKFKTLVIDPENTKSGFKYSVTHKGVKTDFGLGGVHGATSAGVYEAKEGMIIMTSDVTSYYPNLAIRNGWAPAHLPKEEFCEQYEWFFEERKKIPKSDPKNYVYKIILNSTYGLSNDKNSFLYDPEFTMRITINGQLSLLMLYEMLSDGIPGSVPIMQNTDGLEMMIPEGYKEKYFEICSAWEKLTQLQLEHDEYSKLILADVNNYIAVYKNGKTKCKGRFEFKDLALHKNKSSLIVPKAIYAYFINDVVPEVFLHENRNIFDYCVGVKKKGDWFFMETCFNKGVRTDNILQGVVRYYVSNKGCKIIKVNSADGRETQTEAGKWMQTVFNEFQEKPWSEYDVNDDYYLDKIYKEIEKICKTKSNSQLSLF
jgi:hypothetical protein